MKLKNLLFSFAFLFVAQFAMAQDEVPPATQWAMDSSQEFADFVAKEWGLNEEKTAKLYEIRLEFSRYSSYYSGLKKQGKITQQEFNQKMTPHRQKQTKEATKLTKKDWKEFNAITTKFWKQKEM